MVGIFSRFSSGRAGHRRAQSAICQREVSLSSLNVRAEAPAAATMATAHGIETAVEFKPIEHPVEPLDNDRPIQCPLPEPSILNDGRVWKERVSQSVRRRQDSSLMKEEESSECDMSMTRPGPGPSPSTGNRILPSLSAPERNILNLLEECNAATI